MDVGTNLAKISEDIVRAARACGRDPAEIKLVAVSKTFPPAAVSEAARAGQRRFGENRVQEAVDKIPAVEERDLEWHLIGHLQSNKSRVAADWFDVIQTVDRVRIVRRLESHCEELNKTLSVFVQVNVGDEAQKFGVGEDQLERVIEQVDTSPHLRLQGLMAIPPYFEDPELVRPYFRRLAGFRDQVNRGREDKLRELSMGMSGDYVVAIEEGATVVRLGTAIFGPR